MATWSPTAAPPDGPITALNGLLLIGWSVAIIFEVMRMAEVQVGRENAPLTRYFRHCKPSVDYR